MSSVTVSPKFQIVIPKELREKLHVKPGMKLQLVSWGNGIYAVPIRPLNQLKGMLKGMDPTFEREDDRVL